MNNFTESFVENAALAWLESLGYAIKHGTAGARLPVVVPTWEENA